MTEFAHIHEHESGVERRVCLFTVCVERNNKRTHSHSFSLFICLQKKRQHKVAHQRQPQFVSTAS